MYIEKLLIQGGDLMKNLKRNIALMILTVFSFVIVGAYNVKAYSECTTEGQAITSVESNQELGKLIVSKDNSVYQDSDDNIVSGSTIVSISDTNKLRTVASKGVEVGRVNWHISNEFSKGT